MNPDGTRTDTETGATTLTGYDLETELTMPDPLPVPRHMPDRWYADTHQRIANPNPKAKPLLPSHKLAIEISMPASRRRSRSRTPKDLRGGQESLRKDAGMPGARGSHFEA